MRKRCIGQIGAMMLGLFKGDKTKCDKLSYSA